MIEEPVEDYERIGELAVTGLSTDRVSILEFLRKSDGARPSNIADVLFGGKDALAGSHLKRMENSGLITKNKYGHWVLTSTGSILALHVDTYRFISKNERYLATHDFGSVPDKFRYRIGVFSDSEFITGYRKMDEAWRDIIATSRKYVFMVMSEIPTDRIVDEIEKRLEGDDPDFQLLIVLPTREFEEWERISKENHFHERKKNLQVRFVQDVRTAVVLNERQALVFFADFNEGTTDLQTFFRTKPLESDKFVEILLEYDNLIDSLMQCKGELETDSKKILSGDEMKPMILLRNNVKEFLGRREIRDGINLLGRPINTDESEKLSAKLLEVMVPSNKIRLFLSEHNGTSRRSHLTNEQLKKIRKHYESLMDSLYEQNRIRNSYLWCLDFFRYKWHENDPIVTYSTPRNA